MRGRMQVLKGQSSSEKGQEWCGKVLREVQWGCLWIMLLYVATYMRFPTYAP